MGAKAQAQTRKRATLISDQLGGADLGNHPSGLHKRDTVRDRNPALP